MEEFPMFHLMHRIRESNKNICATIASRMNHKRGTHASLRDPPEPPRGGLDGQDPTSHTNTIQEVVNTGTAITQLKGTFT